MLHQLRCAARRVDILNAQDEIPLIALGGQAWKERSVGMANMQAPGWGRGKSCDCIAHVPYSAAPTAFLGPNFSLVYENRSQAQGTTRRL